MKIGPSVPCIKNWMLKSRETETLIILLTNFTPLLVMAPKKVILLTFPTFNAMIKRNNTQIRTRISKSDIWKEKVHFCF